ncbi:MAG: zinc-dependent metalloprotease [Bacteroidales bacterium]|jgi:hypothetical protein|nr:zinc-dependent metalloprotease [Bacteroidales bacterium]
MKKLITVFFVLFFIAFSCREQELKPYSTEQDVNAVTRSQEAVYTPDIKSASLTENDKAILDKHLSKYAAFTLDLKELAGYFKGGAGSLRLQIDEELDWIIDLELNDLRAPDFKATITTGEGVFEDPEPFVVNTYKGFTSDGKTVRFTIDENILSGIILGENYHYEIRPANDYTQNKGDNSFIAYKNWDIIPDDSYTDYVSDVFEIPDDVAESLITQGESVTMQSVPLTRAVSTRSLKIAVDADYEFYQKNGTNSSSRIFQALNRADGVYESTFGISLYVTIRNIYTTSSQPYTSSNPGTLLESFRNYWNANLRGVNRHIAHLFTGKTLAGGTWGASFSGGAINGNTPNNKAYSLSMERTDMYQTTAHEIGHNLNAVDLNLMPSGPPPACECGNQTEASLMCQGTKKSDLWFCQHSINEINAFLSNNSSSLVYISGTSEIYYNGNKATYYLYNAPPGTVTWTVSGPLSLSSTTGSATIVTTTANSGSGTLTAKVNGEVVATQSIGVASPSLGPVTGPDAVYKGSTYVSFQLMPRTYPGLKYEWSAGSLVSASSNTASSEGLFNIPNDPYLDYDMVSCTVSVNGNYIGTYSKFVYVY